MGIFSRFENKMEDAIDGIGDKLFDSPISPVQIAKRAEKQMKRNKMLGAGKQYAPTLYTVLVNPNDDSRLFGYYPTLAGETETYLKAKANEAGFIMDGDPLVRFIVDDDLKSGKFDVIAEAVAGDIVLQLRAEENQRYSSASSKRSSQISKASHSNENNFPGQHKVSSPFADSPLENQNSKPAHADVSNKGVNPAHVNVPVPEPRQAPVNVPVPEPTPIPNAAPSHAAPNSARPQTAAAQNLDMSSSPQSNPEVSPSAETAVFAGGFDIPSQPKSNVAVPNASIYEAATGKSYTITTAVTVIGRDTTCNVVVADANASRQHAQISYNSGI